MNLTSSPNDKTHVVIIGAGFAGLETARGLNKEEVRITVLDRNNYKLFPPLLYQVATSALSPHDIAYPLRAILRKQSNLEFRQEEVTNVDLGNHTVITKSGELKYDYLVAAPGSDTNFFGLTSVAEHALGMKSIDEAVAIRNHVLHIFELAAQEKDVDKRHAMLTFVVVGGGPTGVELAGSLSELIYSVLDKDYPNINMDEARVILLEAGDKLLPALPPDLGSATLEALRRKKIEVYLGMSVTDFDGQHISLKNGKTISSQTLIWGAGVRASMLVEHMGVKLGSQTRAIVSPTLQLPDHPEVFIVGDAAHIDSAGGPLPMTALVALQTGEKAAANIKLLLRGQRTQDFVFHDLGSLAVIGRHAAVGKVAGVEIKGLIAWLLWIAVHIFRLIGIRNRFFVFWAWLWDYVFRDRSMRFIMRE